MKNEPTRCPYCTYPVQWIRDGMWTCPNAKCPGVLPPKPAPPVTVTLSGNSTPLLPTCGECAALRARLAEAEKRAEDFKRIGQEFERDMRKHFDQSCTNLQHAVEAEARAGRAEEAVRVLAEALVARRKFSGTKTGIEVKLNGVKCLGCGCVTFDVYGDEEPFPWEKVGHYAECPRLRVQATEQAVGQNPTARAAVEGAKP